LNTLTTNILISSQLEADDFRMNKVLFVVKVLELHCN